MRRYILQAIISGGGEALAVCVVGIVKNYVKRAGGGGVCFHCEKKIEVKKIVLRALNY